jgi:acyl carrier protein
MKVTSRELRIHLGQHLPDYMVPGVFVFLERLPMTPNGKVDRSALPSPHTARGETVDDLFEPPTNAMEAIVAEMWANVLSLERVGVRDDFFELGGNSLAAAQIQTRLHMRFGVEVPLTTLFDLPTVAQVVESLGDMLSHEVAEQGEECES